MEAIGRLAGGVAHDFNNIIVGLFGYSELLNAKLRARSAPEDELQTLAALQAACQRAANSTRQLLDLSRHKAPGCAPVDVHVLLPEACSFLGISLNAHITVCMLLNATLPVVLTDADQLHNAILNLCINSRDAMPGAMRAFAGRPAGSDSVVTPAADGGAITVSTANVELDAAFCRAHQPVFDLQPGLYLEITVADTGMGFDDSVKKHIFEPFFTTKVGVRDTRTEHVHPPHSHAPHRRRMHAVCAQARGRGTGLGLSCVFTFMQKSHGYIGACTHGPYRSRTAAHLTRRAVDAQRPSRSWGRARKCVSCFRNPERPLRRPRTRPPWRAVRSHRAR